MGVTTQLQDSKHHHNRREYPRIDYDCPILFRHQSHEKWSLCRLLNLSAEGLLIAADQPAQINEVVAIQLRPDMDDIHRGEGTVTRCSRKDDGGYIIAITAIKWDDLNPRQTQQSTANACSRVFPRISGNCPTRYYDSVTRRWLKGHLIDFSATGMLIQVDEPLLEDSIVIVRVEPGENKRVPAIRCSGKVLRCEVHDSGDIMAAITIQRLQTPAKQK